MKWTLFLMSCVAIVLVGCTKPTPKQPIPTNNIPPVQDTLPATGNEAPVPAPAFTQAIEALGTEPFWNFNASGTTLVWNQPNDDGTIGSIPYTVTITTSGTAVSIIGTNIQATLTLQTCSDGMSENSYTHTVVATVGTGSYNGCATISS